MSLTRPPRVCIRLEEPEVAVAKGLLDIRYDAGKIFPDWILTDPEWKNTKGKNTDTTLSDILQIPQVLCTIFNAHYARLNVCFLAV